MFRASTPPTCGPSGSRGTKVLGQSFIRLTEERWRPEEPRRLLLDIIPRSKAVVGYEAHLDVPGQGCRTMPFSARRPVQPDISRTNILLMFEDVTERGTRRRRRTSCWPRPSTG